MISKTILATIVAISFVAVTMTTGTMAYAASNAQGQPFEQLQAQIDSFFDVFTELQATDDSLQEDINAEAQARVDADENLQGQIDAIDSHPQEVLDLISTNTGAIDQEILDRQAADNQLATDLAQESQSRQDADELLQLNIDHIGDLISPAGGGGLEQQVFDNTARIALHETSLGNLDEVLFGAGGGTGLTDDVQSNENAIATLASDVSNLGNQEQAILDLEDGLAREEQSRQLADQNLQDQLNGIGATSIFGVYHATQTASVAALQNAIVSASCHPGDLVTGGGYSLPTNSQKIRVEQSFALDSTTWLNNFQNDEIAGTFSVSTHALCLDITP